MTYKYKGRTPVKTGDWVTILLDGDNEEQAKVIDTLAAQFTAKVPYSKTVRYCFYSAEGVDWRKGRL